MGIPFFYFEGTDEDELPSKTLSQIRIIFLDLVLGPETIEKNIISKIINILRRIIDPIFPYIIISVNQLVLSIRVDKISNKLKEKDNQQKK